MKILVIGGGGREHALTWKIAQSPLVDQLFCAPGNAGIAQVAECVALDIGDHKAVIDFCRVTGITYVVVGPEAPLVAGLVDDLDKAGIEAFGPSAAAAQLEGSKGFTKELCTRHDIPTAAYGRFADRDAALAYVKQHGAPIVVKADGLAAGKGVTVAMTREEAEAAIEEIFSGRFGAAGSEVVIEEYLQGEEASFFVYCDGVHVLPLATAQDHKRVGDGDTGPNTGGMGAYSPAPVMSGALTRAALETIVMPTVRGMAAEGMPYKGVLYAGLIITHEGVKLIEYNCRFGDPECQVLMMRLESDLVPLMLAATRGTLEQEDPLWRGDAALTVVMAANGYPGDYEKGSEIKGLDAVTEDMVQVFHAGTARRGGAIVATGGRVLNVTALGPTVTAAQANAYRAVDAIDWPGGFCRRDIGWRAIERETSGAAS